jgi:hypothetical protein
MGHQRPDGWSDGLVERRSLRRWQAAATGPWVVLAAVALVGA